MARKLNRLFVRDELVPRNWHSREEQSSEQALQALPHGSIALLPPLALTFCARHYSSFFSSHATLLITTFNVELFTEQRALIFPIETGNENAVSAFPNNPVLLKIFRQSFCFISSITKWVACSIIFQTLHYNHFLSRCIPVKLADFDKKRFELQEAKSELLKQASVLLNLSADVQNLELEGGKLLHFN